MSKVSVIVIVTKNGVKYQVGSDKTVDEVITELETQDSLFYKVADTCAIKVSEISSIESFEYDTEEGEVE